MKKSFWITEKIIAGIFLIVGIYNLYIQATKLYELLEIQKPFFQSLSVFQIALLSNRIIILDILILTSSAGLFLNNRFGWHVAFITSLYLFVQQVNSIFKSTYMFSYDFLYPTIWILVAVIFFAIAILLLLKPYREKYRVNSKSFFWVALIFILLIANKFLISDLLIHWLIVNNS